MTDPDRIEEILQDQQVLREEISAILDKHLGEDEGQFHSLGSWTCAMSPIGCCVFNNLDRAKDTCIYCGCPEERK